MRRPLLLLFLLAACTSWQPVTYPAPMDSAFQLHGTVRITEVGGRAHVGREVTGRGDWLMLSRHDGTPDSVARARVRSIEASVSDDRKAFVTVAVVVAIAVALIVAIGSNVKTGY